MMSADNGRKVGGILPLSTDKKAVTKSILTLAAIAGAAGSAVGASADDGHALKHRLMRDQHRFSPADAIAYVWDLVFPSQDLDVPAEDGQSNSLKGEDELHHRMLGILRKLFGRNGGNQQQQQRSYSLDTMQEYMQMARNAVVAGYGVGREDSAAKNAALQRVDVAGRHMHKFWLMGNPDVLFARTNMHLAINVAGDGSCFYQTLHYWLLWLRPEHPYFQNPGTSNMKRIIYDCWFDENGVIKDGMQDHLAQSDAMTDANVVDGNSMNRLLGGHGTLAVSAVCDAASFAFDVQILIYRHDEGIFRDNVGSVGLQFASMMQGVHVIEDGVLVTSFVGKPVAPMLLTGLAGGHYRILSRYPLLEGMQNDGVGTSDVLVPRRMQVEIYDETDVMPFVPYAWPAVTQV